ncbi:hypothetical protein ACLH17_27950 [Klebsiella pasteurii]|uniref:hypothetical protein n=1 Tax=Klebsiella pasteurii TaxID=2587529 RepID=UPI0018C75C13|nr:hypothetical protein [Klebsiella michiganensis]
MKALIKIVFVFFSAMISNAYANDFFYGVAEHLFRRDYDYSERAILKSKELCANKMRIDAPWEDVEKTKGGYNIPRIWDKVINKMVSEGIEPILIIDYGNSLYGNGKPDTEEYVRAYSKYARYLANHFKGRVHFYEIWNEWDSTAGNTPKGNVSDYKQLVKMTYPSIKSVDENITVITGAFSPAGLDVAVGESKRNYLADYMSPEMANYTDGISIHPYVAYRKKPNNIYNKYLSQIEYAKYLLMNTPGFKNKKLYITEIGWTTFDPRFSVSDSEQAKNILNSIEDAKKIGINGVIIYSLRDGGRNYFNSEEGFGIFDYKWRPKKAATVLINSCKKNNIYKEEK